MTARGLLIISNLKQLGHTLQHIGKYVRTLFIHLNVPTAVVQAKPAPTWGKVISQLYIDNGSCHTSSGGGDGGLNSGLDMRVLVGPLKGKSVSGIKPIEMIFSDSHCPELCESLRKELNIPNETIYLQQDNDIANTPLLPEEGGDQKAFKMYDTVVLGGTFDRIHTGHKIFLTQAVLRACRRLVVGVTTANMTKSKTLWELILPVEQRIESVKNFLNEIDASIQYEVVPIDDPFGPTSTDPDMDMIMVSEETLRGGHKVNEVRASKNLKQLEIFCVEMVENKDACGPKETKMSSTNTRIDLLGTRLRTPTPRPHLADEPYIIGLTGTIASGKSVMSKRLHEMGAVVMDCDKIAHEIYEPGQICYEKIVKRFGNEILEESSNRINRKKLGSIVFGQKEELAALDAIVWPELMSEVKNRINRLPCTTPEGTKTVVVIEAAVLLQAGWEAECHEVWSMIVPKEMAIQRVMVRNNLSEEEARKRIESQWCNSEITAKSNIVFCSQWGPEFTHEQAKRAWKILQHELQEQRSKNVNSML